MLVVTLVAFVVFFGCCVLQFPLARGFRIKLVQRHPDVWTKISEESWFIDSAVLKFANSRACRDLADPELSQSAAHIKWLHIVAIGSWLVFAASLLFGHAR